MAPPNEPADPAPRAEALLERGHAIDRFVVIGLVGRGGMGEVYAAYDPELDRKVAIKVLHARGGSADGRARLLREAQAIAKLSHPNVVVVYDVGTLGDKVFIAMEFVEGRTLSGWMLAAQRSRRDVLQVFLAAGRGLAAAHAAGLVHRDFKPDNVMVANDGQVRVMDFGLARQAGEKDAPAAAAPTVGDDDALASAKEPGLPVDVDATMDLGPGAPPASATTVSGKYLSVKLTQTGAMVGTPAYMAPEQFGMLATDPRTDQFSFCVALYEMLYGERPFAGDGFLSLMTNVTTGAVRAPSAKARVPGWMRKVLLRGLRTEPERRYPSMAALLAALEADPTVRWRRIGVGAGVLACAAVAALGVHRATSTQRALCRGGDGRWARVWEANGARSPRKDAIHGAFAASGRTYAELAFTGVSHALDEYVRRWLGMYTEACEATHMRGEQSADVLDLRMSCLQERLESASALSEVLAHADGTVVQNAVSAAGALAPLDRCADVKTLRAVVRPPADAALRARVDALRLETARLVALKDAGRCDEAEKLAEGLLPRVREAGYLPLLADTLNAAADLSDLCTEPALGVSRWREAFSAALASGHDLAAFDAAFRLSAYIADRAGKLDEGRQWLAIAQALLARVGAPPLLRIWALVSEGMILIDEGNGKAAVEVEERVLREKEKLLGKEDPDLALSWNSYGNALHLVGRDVDAVEAFRRGTELIERHLGGDHPRLAELLEGEGDVLVALRRYGPARVSFQRAIDIWQRTGSDPFFISYGLNGLGLAALGEGRAGDAVAPLEEALRIRAGKHAGPAIQGETRFALARALWARRATQPRARALARDARADYAQAKSETTVAAIDAWLAAPTDRL
jgi:tetratricopeptide (TPR) repeat protein/predicted Ser/Thr protein kinase